MDTTNHNNRKCSAMQNANMAYCFAPENKVLGVYFGVDSMLFTILQTNRLADRHYSMCKREKPPTKRKREGFCKEKEKLFAKLRGSPPSEQNRIEHNVRGTQIEFAGFVVRKEETGVLDEN